MTRKTEHVSIELSQMVIEEKDIEKLAASLIGQPVHGERGEVIGEVVNAKIEKKGVIFHLSLDLKKWKDVSEQKESKQEDEKGIPRVKLFQ